MRKTEKRCASCAYHAVDHQAGVDGCAYIQITGHRRLKEAYQRLGVNTVTEEVHEELTPENCRHYQKGKPNRIADRGIVLAGSRPRQKVGLLG